ncbi:ParB family chromosome partitioning protein [Sphingobium sp. OAS761]|uniref:ParB/RepB/Spo0J family partition protein n=1 Tax=Sphingobium sp. OAS761 TaxID=2817901 RepID=UPI00209DC1B6|nr:ParB/RepB/Spo0J family partition protein [Sphingobium sp. OAS761]MCP1471920.1 ParB family chromosome partitioning protein [Sphingobium sp. OAS761]
MIQSVKVKNLSLSKDNVRKSNRDADLASLADNIAAQGLLQNLVVTPLKKAGHFTVKAGGRRLRALQRLIDDHRLPADYEVQVLVLGDEDGSAEASLSENFHRVAMNPADECAAFKHFLDRGASAEDVAKRFGVTTRFVEQRVRLAELAPVVFAALSAGEITLGVAQAYAVTPDVDRQARIFESMSRSYYGDSPDNIRRAVLNGTVKATDAKARFVGRDAYLEAGGRIERDLFGDADEESWVDVEIIEQLAAQKLEAAAEALAAEQKLAFVTPVLATHVPYDMECQLHEYHAPRRDLSEAEQGRVDTLSDEGDALVRALETELEDGTPQAEAASSRLAEIEQELEAIEGTRTIVDEAVREQLGTFVYLGPDGTPRVHSRLFSERAIRQPGEASDPGKPEGKANAARLSATLIDELATQRRQILSAHVASDASFALDLAIFFMAHRTVFAGGYVRDHSTLQAAHASFPIVGFRDEGSAASNALADQRQGLDVSWAGGATLSARFDAFRDLDEQARADWLAYVIGQSLEPTLNVDGGGRHNGFHDHLGRLLGIDVAQWWRPDAQNFFGRVKKDIMLEALEDIGGPVLRGRYKDAKKGDLANACAALCSGQGIVEAEIREKAIAWLPGEMRFDAIEQPERVRSYSAFLSDDDDDGEVGEAAVGDAEDDEDIAEAA